MKLKTISTTLPAVALLTLMTAAPAQAIKDEEVKTEKVTDSTPLHREPNTSGAIDTSPESLEVSVREAQNAESTETDSLTLTEQEQDVTYDAEVETESEVGYLNDSDDVGVIAREGDETQPLTDEYGEDLDATMRYEDESNVSGQESFEETDVDSNLYDDESAVVGQESEWRYGSDEQPSELPRTASPLALMALVGAGGIGGAAGLRRIRRS